MLCRSPLGYEPENKIEKKKISVIFFSAEGTSDVRRKKNDWIQKKIIYKS
jgi:hypothetical protein